MSWFNSLLYSSRAAVLALQSALDMSLFILLRMTEYLPLAILFLQRNFYL